MTIERIINPDGSIQDKITLTEQENTEMDRCHEILRMRFEARGKEYTSEQREICEWWLQGLIRFEGVEKMVYMAQNAPFHGEKEILVPSCTEHGRLQAVKDSTPVHIRYTQQALVLGEIASKLGVVGYRYKPRSNKVDMNTVEFYTTEDAEHNRVVSKQRVQYSRGGADAAMKRSGAKIPDECIYRDSFWSFENSDANGSLSWDFANKGKIDLRRPDWKERVEGHISLALLRKRQIQYVCMAGGWLALQEADETYNDFNRSIINAMKQAYGSAYLGCINYGKEQINQFQAGEGIVYEEYTGQMIYNGTYAFVVPAKDGRLEELIRKYNLGDRKSVDEIIDRIGNIGGEHFSWL